MKINIIKKNIPWGGGKTNAFCFLPKNKKLTLAIFSHGYTSHKGAILPWAIKLSKIGIPTILFDLPGHYIGSFNEVSSFEDFKKYSHQLFENAFNSFEKELSFKEEFKIILGGHSLGSLLALKASTTFEKKETLIISVAHGLYGKNEENVYDTPFFKEAMDIREQLVSPALNPKNIFPWIKEEQEKLSLTNKKIILIGGKDDLIVSEKKVIDLKNLLEENNNSVFLEISNKLPHNTPELASSIIKKVVKDHGFI